jgi:hypothetical protein
MVRTVSLATNRTGKQTDARRQAADRLSSPIERFRRGLLWLVGLSFALASLALASSAAAAPTATLRAAAIPIPGFRGTGDLLGAGAEAELQVTISGTEYGGFPSPLIGLNVYAPAGLRVTPAGFPTCAQATLQAKGASGCPRTSDAGPLGHGLGVVSFGGERVPEEVTIQPFFAPGGGLTFFVVGSTPASFEVLEPGHWTTASAPFGPEMIVIVPLIETVPGANDASVTSFKVEVGAAYRKKGRVVSYLTQPSKCPHGGFPTRLELKFLSGETTVLNTLVPCPRR